MKTAFTRSYSPLAPEYRNNAVLHLVIICAVSFIMIHAVSAVFMVLEQKNVFTSKILPQVALASGETFLHKPWTLITYFLGHSSFWTLLGNMVWLYAFGSMIQSLIGHREIIPLFVISALVAGAVYVAAGFLFPSLSGFDRVVLTAQPGIMAFAIGSITLSPSYRYYLGERLAIPLWLLICIYIILSCLQLVQNNAAMLVLLASGAASGFGYIKLLQAGFKPGGWMYRIGYRIGNVVTPRDEQPWPNRIREQNKHVLRQKKEQYSEEYIDAILDKINQKGYGALSNDEKEALMKASKES